MSTRPDSWYDVQLDLGVISDAFQVLFRRWQEYLLLGFIAVIVTVVFAIPGYISFISTMMRNPNGIEDFSGITGAYIAIYGGVFIGMALAYPFYFGIVNFTIQEVRTGNATLADAWKPLQNFGKYAVAGVCLALTMAVASICGCGLGGIVLGGLFMYVIPIMVNEGLSLGEAMRESFERLKSQWLMATLAYFVASLIASLGQIACGIGILLTFPLVYIIPTMLYLRHLPQQGFSAEGSSPYPRSKGHGYDQPTHGIGEEHDRTPPPMNDQNEPG